MLENQYYMFNTQIPATLHRLISNPLTYSNATADTIPPVSAEYYKEVTYNYVAVIKEYHSKFAGALTVWSQKVDGIRNMFFLRFGFLCLGAVVFIILLGVSFWRESKHKDTLEAFFKFEKEDLEAKIGAIGSLVREV